MVATLTLIHLNSLKMSPHLIYINTVLSFGQTKLHKLGSSNFFPKVTLCCKRSLISLFYPLIDGKTKKLEV